jgi:hypothetical protein
MVSRTTRWLAAAAIASAALMPAAAKAWWRGGVFIGLPPVVVGPPAYYYPPPAYYYPPGYYAPPPAYTPIPQTGQKGTPTQANVPYGNTCYAGFYVCTAPASTHVGTGCSCPGLGAPSYGTVG